MEDSMFGVAGGESENYLARLIGCRVDVLRKRPTLNNSALTEIKRETQLPAKISGRSSLPLPQAQADVSVWMAGKTF